MDTASQSTSTTSGSIGIRKTLKRWKDRWRTGSTPASSRGPSPKASLSRLSSNASSAMAMSAKRPQYTSAPASDALPSIPASPPAASSTPTAPTALFTPTTETFIHSPADPRNRSRTTSTSSTSPPATLKKPPPVSRRNTAASEFSTNALDDDVGGLPLNVVTTTIVAGNANDRKKRTSRLRLSISRRGSILGSSPSSPSLNAQFERCSSRAASRMDERSTSRATGRFEAVPERESHDRVDSDRETLFEENELVKRRPRELRQGEEGTVELAYQYVGSRDGKKE